MYLGKFPLVTTAKPALLFSPHPLRGPHLPLSLEHQKVSQAPSTTDLISEPRLSGLSVCRAPTSCGLGTSGTACAPITQRTKKEGKRTTVDADHTETNDRVYLPKTAAPALEPHPLLTTWGGQSSSDPGVCFLPLDLGALVFPVFCVPGGGDPRLKSIYLGTPTRLRG